jgi:hypothetical protein
MAHELDRISASDDPRRCHGTTASGQCRNISVEGTHHCMACARTDLVEAGRKQYLLTNPRFQTRLAELSQADEIKSLRDEVAIARMLVEERLNKIDTDQDLFSACGAINTLLLTIEKLVSRSHILEQNLGQLYHRSTIVQMMQAFVAVVDDEVRPLEDGAPAIDRIVERIYSYARSARNEEQARGMKLLKDDTQ